MRQHSSWVTTFRTHQKVWKKPLYFCVSGNYVIAWISSPWPTFGSGNFNFFLLRSADFLGPKRFFIGYFLLLFSFRFPQREGGRRLNLSNPDICYWHGSCTSEMSRRKGKKEEATKNLEQNMEKRAEQPTFSAQIFAQRKKEMRNWPFLFLGQTKKMQPTNPVEGQDWL